MLVISVIVCSLVAAAYLFIPEFQGGVADLASDVSVALATGQVGGIGFNRGGGGGGGFSPYTGSTALNRASQPGTAAIANKTVPSSNSSGSGTTSGGSFGTASPLGQPASNNSGVPTLTNIGHNPNGPNQPVLNNGVYHPGGSNQPVLNNGVYHPPPPSGPVVLST